MDDELLNCMTGVCCPPAAQAQALAGELVKRKLCDEIEEATKISMFLVHHFDFAEAGTLKPLRESIVRLSKAQG